MLNAVLAGSDFSSSLDRQFGRPAPLPVPEEKDTAKDSDASAGVFLAP